MAVPTRARRVLWFVALLVVFASAAGHLLSAPRPEGAAGAAPIDDRWDPTGSHPLPNESVERGP
jgi:hypothetical protein